MNRDAAPAPEKNEPWPPRLLAPTDHFVDETQRDWQHNACVGQQLGDQFAPSAYADGFRAAARQLVEVLLEERNRVEFPVDIAVYPIVFLYRHHFELLLKQLIVAARSLLQERETRPHGHNLEALWVTANPLIERCFDDADWSQNGIVAALFAELNHLDPNSEAARYPKSTKGEKHFAELRLLHVRHFADVSERLSGYLSAVLDAIGISDELRRECEADTMRYCGE